MGKKKELPFGGKYQEGNQVWCLISRSKGAWRLGTVKSIGKSQWSTHLTVNTPGMQPRTVYDGWQADNCLMPQGVIPVIPKGTLYLLDTSIGWKLSSRIPGNRNFSVYECSTRVATLGKLLGYLILPGNISQVASWYKLPAYKIWTVPPDVFELLNFLSNKIPEILETNQILSKQGLTNGQETNSELYSLPAD